MREGDRGASPSTPTLPQQRQQSKSEAGSGISVLPGEA